MLAYIKGMLAEKGIDYAVIEAGGLGYMVYMPTRDLDELPYPGEELKLHTYFQVREDAFTLFGFPQKDELELFKQLITVSGIGPKAALAILSTLSADDLRFAILSGDAKAISKAPGVGAKTASRLILELKDKMSLEDAFEKKLAHEAEADRASVRPGSVKNDAVLALNALGYSSGESLKAVSKVEITEDMDVEDVLRAALKHLAFF